MKRTLPPLPDYASLADLLEWLGGVPPSRVRLHRLGRATEKDVTRIERREKRYFELLDGVLVEKVSGLRKSYLSTTVGAELCGHVDRYDLGIVAGPTVPLRLRPGRVRVPDVCFVSWDRLPNRLIPDTPISDVVPDFTAEIFNPENTAAEMHRKLDDYFSAGVRLVWVIDAERRSAVCHNARGPSRVFYEGEELEGGEVLSGFRLCLRSLFRHVAASNEKPDPRENDNA